MLKIKKSNNRNVAFFRRIIFAGICGIIIMLQTSCSTVHRADAPIFKDNTMTHYPGKFVWHDLATSDVDKAKNFYGQLLNWTFEQRGKYTIIKLNDQRIGEIINITEKSLGRHAARWIASLSVPDVKQAVAVVATHGGKILKKPEQIGDRGWVALVRDPQGAQFALIHTDNGDPKDGPIEDGAWFWHELWSNTPNDSANFYKELTGYSSIEKLDSYWILKADNKWRAGIRNVFNNALEQRWVPVIKVNDVKAISTVAKQLGGQVIIEPENPNYVDHVALLADTSGALFMIQEWEGMDAIEEHKMQ